MFLQRLCGVLNAWFPQPPPLMAVAVSGGADSLALTHGLQHWAKQSGKTRILPLIVDHGLRENSNHEAQGVAESLKNQGLAPVVLRWKHPVLRTALMERARYGRYATLAMACHQRNIEHLFLGHHQDDMLETLWMRQKSMGPEHGFSGMSAITMRYGIQLLRPLLDVRKASLEEWLRDRGIAWVEDPTNGDRRFQRTLAREEIRKWSPLERRNAWEIMERAGARRQSHEETLRHLTPCTHEPGYIVVEDFMALRGLSLEEGALWIQSWVYSFVFRSLASLAGQHGLWEVLREAFSHKTWRSGHIIATFGGCLFVREGEKLWIFREYARLSKEACCGHEVFWDDRVFSREPRILIRLDAPAHGPWKERFSRSGLPWGWHESSMVYRPCSWPYPHFSTLPMESSF